MDDISSNPRDESVKTADQFYSFLKSVSEFDKVEVFPVISSIVGANRLEDNCFLGTYYRARSNVESLLCLNDIKHFQALAMLARATFELAVDIRLLKVIPLAVPKMIKFVDVEKLRVANQVAKFHDANPGAQVDSAPFREFIELRGATIAEERNKLWPEQRGGLNHWSGKHLRERCELLKEPFEQLYLCEFPQVSWQTHSGLTGILNLEKTTFALIASHAFKLATESYCIILETIIAEYRLSSGDDRIHAKLKFARLLPFTEGIEQEAGLRRDLFE